MKYKKDNTTKNMSPAHHECARQCVCTGHRLFIRAKGTPVLILWHHGHAKLASFFFRVEFSLSVEHNGEPISIMLMALDYL